MKFVEGGFVPASDIQIAISGNASGPSGPFNLSVTLDDPVPTTSATLTDNVGLNKLLSLPGNGNVYQFTNVQLEPGLVITIAQMQTNIPFSAPVGQNIFAQVAIAGPAPVFIPVPAVVVVIVAGLQ
jgi:hypothetical protein